MTTPEEPGQLGDQSLGAPGEAEPMPEDDANVDPEGVDEDDPEGDDDPEEVEDGVEDDEGSDEPTTPLSEDAVPTDG